MKIKLKSVNQIKETRSINANEYETTEDILCYIPERFFGETLDAEYIEYPYAEVFYIENRKWAIPYDFIERIVEAQFLLLKGVFWVTDIHNVKDSIIPVILDYTKLEFNDIDSIVSLQK